MERDNRSTVVTLFRGEPFAAGERVALRGDSAQHARVRRVRIGDAARLLDGKGLVGSGNIVAVGRDEVTVSLESVVEVPRPVALELIVPVADRDRMLWAAEKCVELEVTAWRPVYFARSRSVSPRGEGARFRDKVEARMRAAMEQSGAAWMPDIHNEQNAEDAMSGVQEGWARFLLEVTGAALASVVSNEPMVLAVGPEGGFEPAEVEAAQERGWILASLGATTLRFETAVVAGAAVSRAAQFSQRSQRG